MTEGLYRRGKYARAACIALTLLTLLLLPALCPAQETEHASTHTFPHQHPQPEAEATPELVEHLGADIPLDLVFLDEEGNRVSLREIVTGPTIIAPVYYSCPNVCTFLQGGLAKALPKVRLKAGEDYRVISVSFDERETPEHARRARATYLAAAGEKIPATAWRFLTGEPQQIRALTDAAGYGFKRTGNDFLHPVAIFVVSAEGRIVRYFYGTSFLPADLTLALIEAREGRVGATVRSLVQFCFSYDPQGRRYVFNLMRVSAVVIVAMAVILFLILTLGGRRRRRPRG